MLGNVIRRKRKQGQGWGQVRCGWNIRMKSKDLKEGGR